MATTSRTFLALGFAVALLAGCDKSTSTTPTSSTTSGTSTDDGYSKKLVGVWESVDPPKKGEPDEKATVEFKADGAMSIVMGPFEMTGTWKLSKADGKTVTIDTEVTMKGFGDPGKSDKKVFKITFDDANTITMTPADKPDPKKLKRKT